ncbi:MAG: 5-formyltetrahydrofolate cyclo-ligase [Ruminococcus sp.]|jgi:5-formyltetrahydrofolate cyclo-ligase|nr:5-formyltetrahydrofolate cyclo-ligase [Ruminococcus sp.]
MILTKTQLRALALRSRYNLPDQSYCDELIFKRLIDTDIYKKSSVILSYVSKSDEIDTRRLIEYSFYSGKTVYCPRTEGARIEFYRIDSFDDLSTGKFGILEPQTNDRYNYDDNAICITPGLMFDEDGYRIGYGNGYYDRYFFENDCFSVGLCRSEFFTEFLPYDQYDMPVNVIITERGITFAS